MIDANQNNFCFFWQLIDIFMVRVKVFLVYTILTLVGLEGRADSTSLHRDKEIQFYNLYYQLLEEYNTNSNGFELLLRQAEAVLDQLIELDEEYLSLTADLKQVEAMRDVWNDHPAIAVRKLMVANKIIFSSNIDFQGSITLPLLHSILIHNRLSNQDTVALLLNDYALQSAETYMNRSSASKDSLQLVENIGCHLMYMKYAIPFGAKEAGNQNVTINHLCSLSVGWLNVWNIESPKLLASYEKQILSAYKGMFPNLMQLEDVEAAQFLADNFKKMYKSNGNFSERAIPILLYMKVRLDQHQSISSIEEMFFGYRACLHLASKSNDLELAAMSAYYIGKLYKEDSSKSDSVIFFFEHALYGLRGIGHGRKEFRDDAYNELIAQYSQLGQQDSVISKINQRANDKVLLERNHVLNLQGFQFDWLKENLLRRIHNKEEKSRLLSNEVKHRKKLGYVLFMVISCILLALLWLFRRFTKGRRLLKLEREKFQELNGRIDDIDDKIVSQISQLEKIQGDYDDSTNRTQNLTRVLEDLEQGIDQLRPENSKSIKDDLDNVDSGLADKTRVLDELGIEQNNSNSMKETIRELRSELEQLKQAKRTQLREYVKGMTHDELQGVLKKGKFPRSISDSRRRDLIDLNVSFQQSHTTLFDLLSKLRGAHSSSVDSKSEHQVFLSSFYDHFPKFKNELTVLFKGCTENKYKSIDDIDITYQFICAIDVTPIVRTNLVLI